MTLDEKLALIHGTHEDPAQYQGQAGYLAGIVRLGIPSLRLADGPPGALTRHPAQAPTATMGVAATFSREAARDNGVVIGREDKALGIDVSLQPFVNLDRDLEFERSYNTFGEDPYLTAEMAVAEVEGIQSQHVMAQIKHFVAYDSAATNIRVDPQTLHEVYLAPFEAAIRRADVASIMCSYNRINGPFACGNGSTLTHLLRDGIGFKGFVTSDWGAIHAVTDINAGVDMEMPGDPSPGVSLPSYFASLPDALRDGTVRMAAIDRAAGRVLYSLAHFGWLDGAARSQVTDPPIDANAAIIERTGEQAAVLLKNDDHALPLRPDELAQVVLIGPTARQVDAIGVSGERAVGLPQRQIGPHAALMRLSGNAHIALAVDDDMDGTPIPANLLSHDGQPGLLRVKGDTGADPTIDFTVHGGNALPANATVTWKGALTVPRAGTYWLLLQALGTNAGLTVDGKPIARTGAVQGGRHGDILQANQDNIVPTTDGLDNVRRALALTAGVHAIEIAITPDSSAAPVQLRLHWVTPEQRAADRAAAIAAARSAKVAVVFVWASLDPIFGLPGDQNRLVEEVAAVNPNTVVVLNTSQPVALPWLGKVKAVLQMWWPGDEGGWSTARLLLGRTSPAGRLPVTWGRRLTDYAATDPAHPERSGKGVAGTTIYSEGVDVGYRWFDRQGIEPEFPFGHGLTYSRFEYSHLTIGPSSGGGLDVRFTLRNAGTVDADEVPQVYVGAPVERQSGVQFPVQALAGFDRVHLQAGESRELTLHVAPRQLQFWSTHTGRWSMPKGLRRIRVGASSRDIRLEADVRP
jgi:beta-glucosidase